MNRTRELINRFGVRPTKSLGQNFLADEEVVKRIVKAADITGEDLVIEIGPGIGSMTCELAREAGHVAAVEIDRHLIPILAENIKDFHNVSIMHQDILKMDVSNEIMGQAFYQKTGFVPQNVKVVANLPYYITTPIIMKFLEDVTGIKRMVFMVQKEVADRILAHPGGKDYGALTVAVQYYSSPSRVFDVPPHCFIPQPEVMSCVIRLDILEKPVVEVADRNVFFKTVKAAFGQRRKTLVNALANSGYFIKDKEQIKQILKNIGIDENQRGETLSILQFAQLANSFCKKDC